MANKSICVYCGAQGGAMPEYEHTATAFGKLLADRGWRLVYGAGGTGLMGTLANAIQEAGGDTFGVIPKHLVDWEMSKTDLTRYVVTENMHERKKIMFTNADAFVALPGGAGTIDEFIEVLTWAQLLLHRKPIILLNDKGYWDPLVGLLSHVVKQGFAKESLLSLFSTCSNLDETFAILDSSDR